MTAKTRFGLEGYGVRRAGSFSRAAAPVVFTDSVHIVSASDRGRTVDAGDRGRTVEAGNRNRTIGVEP